MERVSGAPYHPLTQSKIETNVRTWVHSTRAPEAALTVSYSQEATLIWRSGRRTNRSNPDLDIYRLCSELEYPNPLDF